MNSTKEFDYEVFEHEAIRQLQKGIPLSGKNGVPAPLLKRLPEAGLQGELSNHLREEKDSSADVRNRRNGLMRKRVKTGCGSMEVHTPRDREGSFEPSTAKLLSAVICMVQAGAVSVRAICPVNDFNSLLFNDITKVNRIFFL